MSRVPADPPPACVDAAFELLLCCARLRLEPQDQQRIGCLLGCEVDWDRFVWLAIRHRLVPFAHRHLAKGFPDAVPPEVAQAIEEIYVENAGHALRLTGELIELLDRFAAQGIDAVPYKGPVLAQRLYGSIAMRHTGDLDIMVPREDLATAQAVLVSAGYRPEQRLSSAARAFQSRVIKSEAFERDDAVRVELHWDFVDRHHGSPLDSDTFSERLASTRVAGVQVPAFSSEDLLLILCVHGWKHCWDRLEWVCGIAELLRSQPVMYWCNIPRLARDRGAHARVVFGLRLAQELLGAPLPPSLSAAVLPNRRQASLVHEVRALLAEGGEGLGRLSRRDMFRMRLLDSRRARLRFLTFRMTTPDPGGWILLRVGSRIIPLHTVVEPVRRAFRVGARALRARLSRNPSARW